MIYVTSTEYNFAIIIIFILLITIVFMKIQQTRLVNIIYQVDNYEDRNLDRAIQIVKFDILMHKHLKRALFITYNPEIQREKEMNDQIIIRQEKFLIELEIIKAKNEGDEH